MYRKCNGAEVNFVNSTYVQMVNSVTVSNSQNFQKFFRYS